MNNRFINYLSHCVAYYKKQNQANILAAIKSTVEAAEKGFIGQLGRIFNDFPFSFILDDQKYIAMDDQLLVALQTKIENIINQCPFALSLVNGPTIVTTVEVEQAIKSIMTDILNYAVSAMLDKNHKLKPEIIVALQLETLFKQNERNTHILHEIVFEIIYSYFSQIICANLADIFCNEKKLDVDQVNMFNTLCNSLCVAKERKYNSFFSSFFQGIILQFYYGSYYFSVENCMPYLMQCDLKQLQNIVNQDWNLKEEIPLPSHLSSSFIANKKSFWFDVMTEFKDCKMLSLHQTIFKSLPQDIQVDYENLPYGFPALNKIELSGLQLHYYPHLASQATLDDMTKMLHARDNSYWLCFLLEKIKDHQNILQTEFKKKLQGYFTADSLLGLHNLLLTELANSLFKFELITQPTPIFFENLFNQSNQKAYLLCCLDRFIPGLAQAFNLSFNFNDNGIADAIATQQWDFVISNLINIKLHDLNSGDIKLIQLHSEKIILEFLAFLKSHAFKPTESIELINNVINNQNALSVATRTSSDSWLKWATAVLDKKRRTKSLELLHEYKSDLISKSTRDLHSLVNNK